MKYRPEIDGLRALAVVPVVLFHAGYAGFAGGYVGVDVFFVISGYLITSILDGEMSAGTFSLADFYERRARRILPALWLVCLACIPFAWGLMTPEHLAEFAQSLVAVALFVSNFLFWQQSGYFDTAAELTPLLHTWSLAVEEQFYIVYPLAMLVLLPRSRRLTIAFLALACLASLLLAIWGARHAPHANYFLLPSRGFELGAGALLALTLGTHRPGGPRLRAAASLTGLLLILAGVVLLDSQTPFPGLAALLPVAGTSAIIAFSGPGDPVGRLLSLRPVVLVGLVSYSFYLWHQPVFVFARLWQYSGGPAPYYPLLIALAFALSWVSWRFLEAPFRDRQAMPARRLVMILVPVCAGGAALGLVAMRADGFADMRTGAAQAARLETAIPSPKRSACHTAGRDYIRPQAACRYFTEPARWATFGDSHTVELSWALARSLEATGTGLRHYSFSNCAPRFGQTDLRGSCAEWTHEAADYLAGQETVDTVVVSYRILNYLHGDHRHDYPALPDRRSPSAREAAWSSYLGVLEHFQAAGKRTVLVLSAPELPAPVDYMMRRAPDSEGRIAGVSRDWWEARRAWLMARLDEVPRGVIIVDPTGLFCDAATCYAAEGETGLYFDQNHASIHGMDRIAEAIIAAAPPGTPQTGRAQTGE